MDQVKIGNYLKTVRKNKGLTQEELAEKLGVSRRSVSRWETGANLPDIDLMIELADFYDVDLRDMLTGKTEDEPVDQQLKETALMVAEYGNEEKLKITRRFHILFFFGCLAMITFIVTFFLDVEGKPWVDVLQGITLGVSLGMLIIGFLLTSRNVGKLREAKLRMLRSLTRK